MGRVWAACTGLPTQAAATSASCLPGRDRWARKGHGPCRSDALGSVRQGLGPGSPWTHSSSGLALRCSCRHRDGPALPPDSGGWAGHTHTAPRGPPVWPQCREHRRGSHRTQGATRAPLHLWPAGTDISPVTVPTGAPRAVLSSSREVLRPWTHLHAQPSLRERICADLQDLC